MKTSKIKEIKFEREWAGNYGTMYEFLITTEDGSYGYVNSKTPQFKQTTGEEISFETESRNNKWYLKIQATEKKPFGGGFGGGKSDPARELSIIRQSSLDKAVQLVISKDIKLEEVIGYANRFVKYVQEGN